MPDSSAEFLALQRVLAGRYSLERELGRGGMGIVFLARDVALSRLVAIKLLPPHVAAQPEMRERFLREARTAAGLFHPNVVPIHLVEEDGSLVFFVMAYVDGESVGERVRRAGAMPASGVRRMVQEVAWALSYAHEKGVVHRDVKPDNILLERSSGRALVADFGIARVAATTSGTGRGEVLGTVQYMSPEQATGEPIDGRSDLYSLGVTAFYALTARLPFESENTVGFIHQHVSVSAPRVATVAPSVPAKLAEAVDRCLAKDPASRFLTGEGLAKALAEVGAASQPVPPEIRLLLRQVRLLSVPAVFIVMGLSVGILAGPLDRRGFFLVVRVLFFAAYVPMFGGVILIRAARRAVANGFDMAFVRQTLSGEAASLLEEGVVASPAWSRTLGQTGWSRFIAGRVKKLPAPKILPTDLISFPLLAFSALVLRATLARSGRLDLIAGAITTLLLLTAVFAASGVPRDSTLASLDWGASLLVGRFGRVLFRFAKIGLKQRAAPATAAGERTEIALASAIDDLVLTLPRELRARFTEVREVVGRLDADAVLLRAREASLSDTLARVEMHAGVAGHEDQQRLRRELEAARSEVRGRLATAVAAIESIRLDLLRLHAGIGSPDDLTAALERARELGSALDAEILGRRAVEQLLAPQELSRLPAQPRPP